MDEVDDEDFFDQVMRILGSKTRRSMLELLTGGPRFLSDISKELDIGQQSILRHIQEFTKAGILEETEDSTIEEKKIGRKPKYYKIAENRRIIIDITPGRFFVDTIPAFLEESEGIKAITKTKYCFDLENIEKEITTLERIMDPNERFEKIKKLEKKIQDEINYFISSKHFAEVLLKKLSPKLKVCEDYLGVK